MGTDAASDKYSGALAATLVRSRRLVAFLAGSGSATVVLVLTSPLPLPHAVLLTTFTLCLAMHALHRACRTHLLYVEHSGAVSVDGVAGHLRPGSFVAPWLTIVRWRPANAWVDRTLPVLPDMLPSEDSRHLRVILRWGRTT
ncbi:MAG TPA: protein YgfX [Usitatibacter sp.]|nr:protein YgfX [Usitatibacter sp.]